MIRTLLTGLVACLLLSACGGTSEEQPGSGIAIEDPCAAADFQARQHLNALEYDEAMVQLEQAIEACQERPEVLYRSLRSIGDIAQDHPDKCKQALELHGRVPPSSDTDYLRASWHLTHVCPGLDADRDTLNQLADVEALDLYGEPDAAKMRPYVERCESARLARWAVMQTEHVRLLADATRTLCEDDEVLRLAAGAVEPDNDGRCNAGFVVGYWYLQPTDAVADDLKPCLVEVFDALASRADRYPEPDGYRDFLKEQRERYR